MTGPVVVESHSSRYYNKNKTTRKRNCGVLQGGNYYDSTTQYYINEC